MPVSLLEQILVDEGHIDAGRLSVLTERRARTGEGIVTALLEERLLSFETVALILLNHLNIEVCELHGREFSETSKITGHFYADKYAVLPIRQDGAHLYTAMRDPLDERALSALRGLTGLHAVPMLARGEELRYYINAVFAAERIHSIASRFLVEERAGQAPPAADAEMNAQLLNVPAVNLIDSLIESAVTYRASDVHIEPYEKRLRARYRVDGILKTFQDVEALMLPNVISRLKVMGGMDIAEKRLPQDGHFTMRVQGETVDFRLSTLPTLFGEKAVLRLLYNKETRLKKEELGFFPGDLEKLTGMLRNPYGAVFITGPTGSGKSTTLSCFIEELNTEALNIVTAEEPVESPLHGVNHMSVDPASGRNFADLLRHILRQDPDVIVIGEIRDEETARIAIQAAITGHLVLSTLHTNDAAGVLERLIDMGIKPYLAAAALSGVISQRLVRRICSYCKTEKPLDAREAILLGVSADAPAFEGAGCSRCGGTGYKGRFAIYEYFIVNEKMRRLMSSDVSGFTGQMRQTRSELRENAVKNIELGNTTASEVIRVLHRELHSDE